MIRKMTIADYDAVYDLWINTPDDSREGIGNLFTGTLM